ncbi:MAG: STAS/SEC14 domain-containing protein [Steroidobacteraceae bacterium]
MHATHVELECTGTYTLESSLQVYGQAFEIATREGRGAVLVDIRRITGGPPTLMDRYQQGVHVAELQAGPGRRTRFALVGHEPMIHPQRFGEVIATSHGAIARVFTDLDEALAWISG